MLEAWWFEGILDNFSHLDDALFEPVRIALLTGGISDEGSLPLAIRDILGLSSLDFPIDKFLQRCPGLVGCRITLILCMPLHHPVVAVQIFPVCEGDEVFELRLNKLARALALSRNGVIAYIALRIDLKSQSVASSRLICV